MSELVERVARAIYAAENPQGRLWEDRADGTRGTYLALARAALAALREPTKEMVAALDWHPDVKLARGDSYASVEDHQKYARKRLIDAYQLMIDAALEDEKTPPGA